MKDLQLDSESFQRIGVVTGAAKHAVIKTMPGGQKLFE
jgi:hypothetical protein